MSKQTQKGLKPQREKWFVFLYPAFFGASPMMFENSMIALAKATVIDQKLVLRELLAFFNRFELTPRQVIKIEPSKILYFSIITLLLVLSIFVVALFYILGKPISSFDLALLILLIILIIILTPAIFLKCLKIHYQIHTHIGHIYLFCLRCQYSSILNALTRCGFGDKLEQPHSPSHSE